MIGFLHGMDGRHLLVVVIFAILVTLYVQARASRRVSQRRNQAHKR